MRGADSRDAERNPAWNFGDQTHPLLREQLEKNAQLQAQNESAAAAGESGTGDATGATGAEALFATV